MSLLQDSVSMPAADMGECLCAGQLINCLLTLPVLQTDHHLHTWDAEH
jgi:hypothetical protein